MVSPKHVWIGNNPINSVNGVSDQIYQLAQGYVLLAPPNPKFTLPVVVDFYNQFLKLADIDADLLKSNRNYTSELLATRQLQEYMDFKLFQNTGYNGASWQPISLREYGDLLVPYAAYSFTGEKYNMTAFGQTNLNGTSFEYISPIFNGVSTGSCIARVWFQVIGYSIVVGSMIMKMQLGYKLVLSNQKVGKGFNTWRFVLVPVAGIAIVEVILLCAWQIRTPHGTLAVQLLDTPQFMLVCDNGPEVFSNPITIVLMVYNYGLLVVSILYMILTRDIEHFTGETAFASLIVASFGVAGVMVVPVLAVNGSGSETMVMLQVATIFIL
ncbi:hypothetical protein HDU98_006312 [Podochytrium sp. JEL0797]|nr:hypothetical protein HDU98_006312 [Podochytrium sp. JEL0797]